MKKKLLVTVYSPDGLSHQFLNIAGSYTLTQAVAKAKQVTLVSYPTVTDVATVVQNIGSYWWVTAIPVLP